MQSKDNMEQNERIRENASFRACAELVLRYRWFFLATSLLLSAAMGYAAYRDITVDTSVDALLSSSDESLVVLEELRDEFGSDQLFMVMVEGQVFTSDYLKRLKRLHDDLAVIDVDVKSLGERKRYRGQKAPTDGTDKTSPRSDVGSKSPDRAAEKQESADFDDDFADFGGDEGWGDELGQNVVDRIISLINVRKTSGKGGTLRVEGLMDEWPTEHELGAFKERVLSDETLVGQVVGKKGTHSVIILATDFMNSKDANLVYQEILRITKRHQRPDFKLQVAGNSAFSVEINSLILKDFGVLTTLAAVVMFVFSVLIFRHPVGVFGPMFVVAQAALWIFGAMALADVPMTVVTNILPAFLACVGVGDSIHILSVYRDARAKAVPNREAIVHAIATTGVPIFYTSLTTAIGLLSFHLSSLSAISDMGTFGALGIFVAFVYSIVFLPIVLSFNSKSLLGARPEGAEPDWLDRFLLFLESLSRDRTVGDRVSSRGRKTVLLTATVISAIACIGVSMIRVYHNPITWIPPEYRIRRATEELNDKVGGAATVSILITAPKGRGLADRRLLESLQKLADHIKAYKDPTTGESIVSSVLSVLDPIRESWRALNDDKQAFYRVPDTQTAVNDTFTLLNNAAPDEMKRLMTIDATKALMTVRVNWMDSHAYQPLTQYINEGVAKYIGDQAVVKVTGSAVTFSRIMAAFVTDLLKSFGTACILITFLMIALLRDIKLGLIAMIPNLLPIIAIMGFMGFASIPLDMSTLLIASIIIGIAVDDTIHFLHQFRVQYRKERDVEAAIAYAISHTGRAMLLTSAILVVGFSIFLSANMINLQRFGILSGLAIVFASFFDVVFAPALLRTIYRSKDTSTALLKSAGSRASVTRLLSKVAKVFGE